MAKTIFKIRNCSTVGWIGGTLLLASCGAAPVPDFQSAEAPSDASAEAMSTAVSRLFAAMDAVGPGADRQYADELRAFLARPQALHALRETYAAAPASDHMRRWMAVNVAAQLPGTQSLAFMESALYELPNIDPSSRMALALEQPTRFRAALSVINGFIEGKPEYDAALSRMLSRAEPAVARFAATQLFSQDRLDPAMRAALDARDIESSFRRMGLEHLPELARMEAEISAARTSNSRNDGTSRRTAPGRVDTLEPAAASATVAE